MTVLDRSSINLGLKECHDSPSSGHLCEDRTREKCKTLIWWPMWQNYVAEYCKTCEISQNANKSVGKRPGTMIKIHKPSKPWFSNAPVLLPCRKDYTATNTALMLWNRVVSWTGIFTNIISDRDPKFISALWKNLHQFFRTKLSFSTAYHPQTHGL
ncbi:hypothetical protein O181_111663, partial [Austropuccinia psidii MF-1]|nr:hypothetical protein [Austropuccinia psidii MF-1]